MYRVSSESTCICCIMQMDVSHMQPFAHHQAGVNSVMSWRTRSTRVLGRLIKHSHCVSDMRDTCKPSPRSLRKNNQTNNFLKHMFTWNEILMGYLDRADWYCGKLLRVGVLWRFPVPIWAESQAVLRVFMWSLNSLRHIRGSVCLNTGSAPWTYLPHPPLDQ